MKKPLLLMVMILALVVGAGGGTQPANAGDVAGQRDLVRQQPGRHAAEWRRHGHGP